LSNVCFVFEYRLWHTGAVPKGKTCLIGKNFRICMFRERLLDPPEFFSYIHSMLRKPLNNPSLENHLATLSPDGITWFSMGRTPDHPEMRGVVVHGSRAVCQMKANHGLGHVEAQVLGKGLLCSALVASLLKDPGCIMLRLDGSGPAEGMSAESMLLPSGDIHARGRLFRDPFPPEVHTLGSTVDLFGPGALTVTRMEGGMKPVTGSIALKTGHLNKDLTWYFYESEQTRTAIDSGIYLAKDGAIHGAGALLLQALPGADDAFLAEAETRLSGLPPLGLWFAQGGTRDRLIDEIFSGLGAWRSRESGFSFDCPCSAERFIGHIAALGDETVRDIFEHGPWPLETHCHYCASTYRFQPSDLEEALQRRRRVASRS
jgi:molecular chaperone Hsp33